MAKTTTPHSDVPKWLRLELVRRMLLEGIDEATIISRLSKQGVPLPDGRKIKVKAGTAQKYLDEVGAQFAKIHDDPRFQERIVGTAITRLSKIAKSAEAAGKYHAAISATRALVSLVGVRSERWRTKRSTDDARPVLEPESSGIDAMSEEDLDAELRSIERRFDVYDGGKASSG